MKRLRTETEGRDSTAFASYTAGNGIATLSAIWQYSLYRRAFSKRRRSYLISISCYGTTLHHRGKVRVKASDHALILKICLRSFIRGKIVDRSGLPSRCVEREEVAARRFWLYAKFRPKVIRSYIESFAAGSRLEWKVVTHGGMEQDA